MSLRDVVIGLALLAALVWGLNEVALAPLETGEVYPPYSSLRSDPLGAKALYESLAALPDITVERFYKSRPVLENPRTALFVLGVDPVGWSGVEQKMLEEYEALVRKGGRLVIAFLPARSPTKISEKHDVKERWDIELKYARTAENTSEAMPKETSLYFEAGPEWKQLPGHNAVSRTFDAGDIVLVADTFPLSNEGLRDARDAGFIAQLTGPADHIIFDENHFGVVESGSVTKLIRKYRLEAAVLALALAAALFIWRGATSFLPPRVVRKSEAVVGRDSIVGMAALLRRGVPEKDLLETCFAEWSKAAPRDARGARLKMRVEEQIKNAAGRDPVQGYRAATQALTEKT